MVACFLASIASWKPLRALFVFDWVRSTWATIFFGDRSTLTPVRNNLRSASVASFSHEPQMAEEGGSSEDCDKSEIGDAADRDQQRKLGER